MVLVLELVLELEGTVMVLVLELEGTAVLFTGLGAGGDGSVAGLGVGGDGSVKAGSQYDARLALRTLRCVRHILNHSA